MPLDSPLDGPLDELASFLATPAKSGVCPSCANLSIANAAVLVPTSDGPSDRVASGVRTELIPDRPVIGSQLLT